MAGRVDRRKFLQAAASLSATGVAVSISPDVLAARPKGGSPPAAGRREIAAAALGAARSAGASYADCRVARYRRQSLSTREERVISFTDSEDAGFGVRVLVDGTWGFSASPLLTVDEAARIAGQAVAVAKANRALQVSPVTLAPTASALDTWQTPVAKDPFLVPLEAKVSLLLAANREALKIKGAKFVNSSLFFAAEDKLFASTEGSVISQRIVRVNPSFVVTAVDKDRGEFKTRGLDEGPMGTGYEYVEGLDLVGRAPKLAEEAVASLSAPSVEPGKKDLILHPTHLWLTIHESVGHPTELDRALGYEANFAGTSFCTPDKLGKLKYASDIVSFVADRTQAQGLATCGYDDDGVKTTEWDIVKDGVFVGYQTTREQAVWIGETRSRACAYADSWRTVPFQRMPNVSLRPGKRPLGLEDLIAATDDGILIRGNGSYSIDHQRFNFQFGGQAFWEVKGGKVTRILRDVAYQANTVEFWNACDMLAGSSSYQLGGSFFDGKGEPQQSNAVSHGCPAARFRSINVINTGRKT